eukprot:245216-Pelagomonas_calceolata.AAC.11
MDWHPSPQRDAHAPVQATQASCKHGCTRTDKPIHAHAGADARRGLCAALVRCRWSCTRERRCSMPSRSARASVLDCTRPPAARMHMCVFIVS